MPGTIPQNELHLLHGFAERYLGNDLTEPEMDSLLDLLERYSDVPEILRDNVFVDMMLQDLALEEKQGPSPLHPMLCCPNPVFKDDSQGQDAGKISGTKNSAHASKHRRKWGFRLVWQTLTLVFLVLCFVVSLNLLMLFYSLQTSIEQQPLQSHLPSAVTLPKQTEASREATSSAVAIISKLNNVVWEKGSPTYDSGSIISPGWLKIKSGLMKLQFFSGTSMVIEGPAEFMVANSNRAHCLTGNVMVDVPQQAIGFTINVPQMAVVDRGTTFSMNISPEVSVVRVHKGMVDLEELPSGVVQLLEGEAARVTSDGNIKCFQTDQTTCLNDEIQRMSILEYTEQLKLWQTISEKINNDPSVLIHFDMEFFSENDYRLLNNAKEGKKFIGDGIVVGCRKGVGNIPGKGALEFRQISDRVRFYVPQELGDCTLMTRLRVDALFNTCHSIIMSEDEPAGNVSWFLCNEHSPTGHYYLRLCVVEDNGQVVTYDSPVYFTSERIGKWVELGVVVNTEDQTVTHYVNKKQFGTLPLKHKTALKIGRAELGNWNAASQTVYPIRNFTGSIENFIIYRRSVLPDEFQRIYTIDQ